MNTGNNALNKTQNVLKHSFNPYMTPNITLFVIISIILMMYAFGSVFFGLPPLDENNPFDFMNLFNNLTMFNGLIVILNLIVVVGLGLFVFLGAKDILEQRVVFDS